MTVVSRWPPPNLGVPRCGRCVFQSRLRETREGRTAQFRCRAAGSDRLQRALPKRLFLWLCKPLLRTTLFACGFYWVQDRTLPGYRYDARACVVANQAGPIELMYFLWNFPGTPVLDMSILSAFMLPGFAALGVLDSATVEQLADDSVPSPRSRSRGREQTSALAQYQCMMALHNETHGGLHFGLTRLCLFLSGSSAESSSRVGQHADDELLDGAFACGLPLQPIWVRCARAGEPYFLLRTLTSWSNQMEVLLLPVFAPTEDEKADPELFRRNVMAVMHDASSRLRRKGRPAEIPFGEGAGGPRKPAMEDSWRVVDDQDQEEDEDDSDWSLDDAADEHGGMRDQVDVEHGAGRKKSGRRKAGHRARAGKDRARASAAGDGGARRAERTKTQRDQDRVQRERERLNRKRARMASPTRASMPNLGSMESEDDLDLSEEEIPATHWGARILHEDEQRQSSRSSKPHPPAKATRSRDRSGRNRSKAKQSSQPDVQSLSSEDDVDIQTPRGLAGDIFTGRGKRNGPGSEASRGQPHPPARPRPGKDDGVRGAASARPVLNGGGVAGWQRMHKEGDYAGVVRWCVDCELAEDTLLVGMPLTDYEMGIVAPTFCEMLGLDEAVVTRQHENGGVAVIEELEASLRDAFRSLSRHLHPDKQSGRDLAGIDDATAKGKATADFQLLKLAKETLEDGKARARYLKKLGAFRRNAVRVPWSFSSAMMQQQRPKKK